MIYFISLTKMFSSHSHLKRRTPEGGIPRPDYIEHLVEEYLTTTNVEAKEQVTANLANFAYDPINWEYLCEAGALDVFEDCIKSPNERLQLHALAGFCNMCLDTTSFKFITKSEVFGPINLLMQTTETTDIYLNCIALFYQLLTADICTQKEKSLIVTPPVLRTITKLKNLSPDPRRLNSQITTKYKEIKLVKRFTQLELDQFSSLTADSNPIHSVDTPISERKVHGAFLNAIVAGIIGTQMPGAGTIVLSQKFNFPNACHVDVDTFISVRLVKERKISLVEYECRQGEQIVFIGEAKLLIKR
ncbi:uncharacterized protein LOC129235607 isoform X2 [Anastrepha obliqua]|uniref:uncharacterized protein LOC129235607 isoform X2 n=1 Tax=Anastrepha obliqua TaxID=95512 RepID=UPI00240A843B|nr:uncharacterized protein LOC129235607 isoform X2 [Anastrepha obliqua]